MSIRVNDEEITEAAVQYELKRLVRFYSGHMSAKQVEEQMGLLGRKAREQAIGAKLLTNEARKLDLQVPDSDVEAGIKAMTDNAGGRERFESVLRKQNLTMDALKQSIIQGRRVDMLIERITEGISDPTEKEMEAHFREHAREYRKADCARAQHILIKFNPESEENRKSAGGRLLEIRKQIEEGADFADEAAAHSDCPSGRKSGGSLGWLSRGMMVPEFDGVVFSMEVGELSDLVETPLGYHIIKKTGHKKGGEPSFDEVRDKIREFLRHARRGAAISEYVKELKKTAVIEEG